jgi:polysaccharide deacetylase 2 family uncharacterized protein YibQ
MEYQMKRNNLFHLVIGFLLITLLLPVGRAAENGVLPATPRIAIIIDDVGEKERIATDELLEVPARLTWAVLPLAPFTREYAEKGRARGFEVLMHQPLETIAGKVKPYPGYLGRAWTEAQILLQLDFNLQQVPEAVGVNNHMGTTAPGDILLTTILMAALKKRGFFYIDSWTDQTIAAEYAAKYGVPFAKRDVFIDHYRELEPNKASVRQLIRIALKNGRAIGIGHTRPGTARLIREMLPEIEAAGVKIVPVSELVR